MLISLFLSFLYLERVQAAPDTASATPSIVGQPMISRVTEALGYYTEFTRPASCRRLLQPIKEAVRVSNQQFIRRGWSPRFLEERFGLAKEYATRSEYVRILKTKDLFPLQPEPGAPVVGTMGVTVANYGSGKTEGLPVEKVLEVQLPRPKRPAKKTGKIFELRTYSKVKPESTGEEFAQDNEEIRTRLLDGALRIVEAYLKDDPELWDEPILYLYADELSVRFYSRMGFKVLPDIPPTQHLGSSWQVMAVTPRMLQMQIASVWGMRDVRRLTYPYPIHLRDGRTLEAHPGTEFRLEPDGTPIHVILNHDFEVAPGIFAAAGTKLTGLEQSSPRLYLARPAWMPVPGVIIPAGSFVLLNDEGKIESAYHLGAAVEIPQYGITVKKDGSIFTSDPLVSWQSTVEFRDKLETFGVTGIKGPTPLARGIYVEDGGTVAWVRRKGTTRFDLYDVDPLARPIRTGLPVKVGERLFLDEKGKSVSFTDYVTSLVKRAVAP